MNTQRGFLSTIALLAILLGLIVVGGGVYYVAHQQMPSPTLSDNTFGNSQTSPTNTTVSNSTSTQMKLPLLTFISPQSGIQLNVTQGAKIQWSLTDRTLLQTFPNKDTYIYLQLISANGSVVGVVLPAPSPHISDTSASWNIMGELNHGFFKLTPGAQYKIRATLSYEARILYCNPAVKGECYPVYSSTDQALRDKVRQYQSESGWFTFDLSSYVRPAAAFDSASLIISSSNSTVRGTSNLSPLKLIIGQNSKYLVQTTVSVVNGKWSYTPSLPAGTYSVDILDPSGSLPYLSATLTIQAQTYTNSQYGVSLQYPNTVQVTTNATYRNPLIGASIGTDIFQATYKDTTLDVVVSTSQSDIASCGNNNSANTITIGGVVFTSSTLSDGGAGQEIVITSYAALHGNACYQIIKTWTGTAASHLSTVEAQQQQATQVQVSALLDPIVQSLHFTQ
jgi:hypothetical protein